MRCKFILILLTITSLMGCATRQKYEASLNRYLGESKQQLIAALGSPKQIKQLANGDEILTYISINQQVLPDPNFYYNMGLIDEDEAFYPFTYGGDAIPDGNFMGQTITDYCKTKFYLRQNKVTSWQFNGNACVAL